MFHESKRPRRAIVSLLSILILIIAVAISLLFIINLLSDSHYTKIDQIVLKNPSAPDDTVIRVNYLNDGFRARIPVFRHKDGTFFTTYNFDSGIIAGPDTIYLSPDGDDTNPGDFQNPKHTLENALASNPQTIILCEGKYSSGENFRNGTAISGINLIGIGKVTIDNNAGNPLVVTGDIFLRNITFTNGNFGSLRTYITDTTSRCTYVNCKFNNAIVDDENIGKAQSLGGLRVQGGTHFLYRCEASHNGFDGFNYHAAPDTPSGSHTSPHVAEVECRAFFNGEHNSYESDNASTAHDGTQIIRLNGEYGHSHGGVVADVHKGTVSFNLGCTAHSAMDLGQSNRQYQANWFCASGATLYMLGCQSYNSFYDISCWNGGTVLTDSLYHSNYSKKGKIRLLE